MIYKEILPCTALRPYVRNYLLVHFEQLPDGRRCKPYPARIEQALVFFARGHIESHNPQTGYRSRIASNALFGQQVSRLNFGTYTQPDFVMLMVIFQPGALYRLLRLPNHELTQEYCDAELLFGAALKTVNDQIANANSYGEMIERTENFLLQKLRFIQVDTHPVDQIATLLLRQPTPFSLDWLANQANLSARQFERKFSARIGIGPKLFSRISRFHQAFTYKDTHTELDWLSVAVQFGYTDYYHLAKDFRQFANVTPNILLREYAQRPEIIVNL